MHRHLEEVLQWHCYNHLILKFSILKLNLLANKKWTGKKSTVALTLEHKIILRLF